MAARFTPTNRSALADFVGDSDGQRLDGRRVPSARVAHLRRAIEFGYLAESPTERGILTLTPAGRSVLGHYDPAPDVDLAAWVVRRRLPVDLTAEDVDRFLREHRADMERAALDAKRPTLWRIVYRTPAGEVERLRTGEEHVLDVVTHIGHALRERLGGPVTATIYRPGGAVYREYPADRFVW